MADANEFQNLKSLMELKQAIADMEIQLTAAEDTVNQGGRGKKKAQQKLKKCKEELDDLTDKELTVRELIKNSWSSALGPGSEDTISVVPREQIEEEIIEITAGPTSTTSKSNFKLPKPDKFKRGDNFTRFCEDFQDYIKLGKIKDENLNIFFLSLVDNFTKDKLKKVALSSDQRRDEKQFLQEYIRKMTPPHEAQNLMLKLSDLKQIKGESIEDFAYRLREMSSRAYSDDEEASKLAACYSAFLKGLINQELRIKLRENTQVKDFEIAVEEACRLQDIRESEVLPQEKTITPTDDIEILRIDGDATRDYSTGNSGQNYSTRDNSAGNSGQTYRRRDYNANYSGKTRDRPNNRGHQQGNNRFKQNQQTRKDKNSDSQKSGASQPQQQNQNGGNRKGGRTIICYKCQEPNHFAQHCTLNC